jgi:photosystem II stability/assembly factor-like uncharacterized protein
VNTIQRTRNAVSAFRQPTQAFRVLALCAFLALGSLCASVQAQVPQTINYQGFLTSNTGVPVNISQVLTFRIYDDVSAGNMLWSATQLTVPVVNGVFNVILGGPLQNAPFPPALVFDKPYFLSVQVNPEPLEMSPRQPLQMSPYAYRAVVADNVSPTATIAGSQVTGSIAGAAPWVAVSGPSQQAVSNTGYIVTGATPTTITLPPTPAVGDVVKVTSPGSGGFTLAPNAGQTITGNINVTPITWIPRDSARGWVSVASSADGAKLVAANGGPGQIYTSIDSGVTWTPRDSTRAWISAASSADGTKLVAVVNGGQIYTSIDSGVTWTPRDSTRFWISAASSADGTKLVAAVESGLIYTSTDSGVTWTPRDSLRLWISVASSADGSKLVAAVVNGQIYTSTDSGVTWIARDSARGWQSVTSSADGTKLVAGDSSPGLIYTSTDSGLTWIPRDSVRIWWSVASSADGTKLVAGVDFGGLIYNSNDSGLTWAPRDSARNWSSVASSADGAKLVAVAFNGQIYTWAGTRYGGGQSSTIELVYAGAGQWTVVNQQGSITLQ